MDEDDEQPTFRLVRRTPEQQIEWLIHQYSFLQIRVEVLEREVRVLKRLEES